MGISGRGSYEGSLLVKSLFDLGFPGGSAGKESALNAGDLGLIPGSGRSPGREDALEKRSILAWRISWTV